MFDWIPLAYDTPIFYVFIFVIVLNFCLKVLVKGYRFVPNTSVFNVFSVLILVFSLFFIGCVQRQITPLNIQINIVLGKQLCIIFLKIGLTVIIRFCTNVS